MRKKSNSLAPLDKLGWLANEPPELKNLIAAKGHWRWFEAGSPLFLAGDVADGLYGLGEGALDIAYPFTNNEQVVVHRAEVGFWAGDAALLAERPRMVTASAATDCRVLYVHGQDVRALLAACPSYWRSFYRLSNINLATSLNLLAEALVLSPRQRVARHLLRLSAGRNSVTARQTDFATIFGVTRATMQRAIAELTDCGAIKTGYRHIDILDRTRLSRMAAD